MYAVPRTFPGPSNRRRVEEVFVSTNSIIELTVRGRVICTTAAHPFYVREKGWTEAWLLIPGDLFRSHDGQWLPLDSVASTGEETTVYNLRISEYSTYFVGDPAWGFSVWHTTPVTVCITSGRSLWAARWPTATRPLPSGEKPPRRPPFRLDSLPQAPWDGGFEGEARKGNYKGVFADRASEGPGPVLQGISRRGTSAPAF